MTFKNKLGQKSWSDIQGLTSQSKTGGWLLQQMFPNVT